MCDYMITSSELVIFVLVFKWRRYISSVLKFRVFTYSKCLNKTIIIELSRPIPIDMAVKNTTIFM